MVTEWIATASALHIPEASLAPLQGTDVFLVWFRWFCCAAPPANVVSSRRDGEACSQNKPSPLSDPHNINRAVRR